MSDIAEGLGGAVEGSLLGRAVEPEHGGKGLPTGEEGTCLNCGSELGDGPYCQNCGQKSHVHRTLTAILHDLIHGVPRFTFGVRALRKGWQITRGRPFHRHEALGETWRC